jgi:hypothetical protein
METMTIKIKNNENLKFLIIPNLKTHKVQLNSVNNFRSI